MANPSSTDSSPAMVSSAVVIPTESLVVPATINMPSADSSNKRPRPSSSSNNRQFNNGQQEETKRPRLNTDNPEMKKRNQRLFGMILGTLHQSEADNAKKIETIEKRAEIERRLQAKLAKEKEDIAQSLQEKRKLRAERSQRDRQEHQERIAQGIRECKMNQARELSNFIKTKSLPALYYLPSRHTEGTQEALAEQKRQLALDSANEGAIAQDVNDERRFASAEDQPDDQSDQTNGNGDIPASEMEVKGAINGEEEDVEVKRETRSPKREEDIMEELDTAMNDAH